MPKDSADTTAAHARRCGVTARTRLTIVAAVASMLAMPRYIGTGHGGPRGRCPQCSASLSWPRPAWDCAGFGCPLPLVLVGQLGVLVLWLVCWWPATSHGSACPHSVLGNRLLTVFTDGLDAVAQYAAPVPVTRGILLLLVGGAGLVAVVVDLFAVGIRRVPLTGIAPGAIYALAASVVPGGLSWIWFLQPAIGFLGLLVAEGRTRVVWWGRSAESFGRRIPAYPRPTRCGHATAGGSGPRPSPRRSPCQHACLDWTEGVFDWAADPAMARAHHPDRQPHRGAAGKPHPSGERPDPALPMPTPRVHPPGHPDVFPDGEQWSISNRPVDDTTARRRGCPRRPG